MKPCPYCGRENDDSAAACAECGNSFSPAIKSARGITIPTWLVILSKLILSLGVMGFCVLLSLGLLIRGCDPATPKTGYTGDWRSRQPHLRMVERPLPAADAVWDDYNSWTNADTATTERIYYVKLSGAHRQKNLKVDHGYTKNMPLGDHNITTIHFDYHDETNGVYHFTWMMRGHHSPDFLKLTDQAKIFQVIPWGSENGPPWLAIRAIEGVTPFR